MRTVGLIVEYNPLHYGHVHHFRESLAVSGADAAIAVMSGHFLQRGEPALLNKWARAETALRMGVDLVLELPVAFAPQPAEWFAYGAVSALDATGVVDCLCFGSESGEIGWLQSLAKILHREPEVFTVRVKQRLKTGISYPAAYSQAVAEFVPGLPDGEIAKPNNSLGLHYLIALERLGSSIVPLTIARQKADYHQQDITDRRIASATAIRKLLFEQGTPSGISPYVPETTLRVLENEWKAGRAPVRWESFFQPLMAQLINRSAEELAQTAEVTEGLQHRIKQALPALDPSGPEPVEQLINLLKTKRYTRTKLQRTLLRILLGHAQTDVDRERLRRGVPYLRVLGFSSRGRELLKKMKTTAKVPIVMKVTKTDSPLMELDIRATSIYALGYRKPTSRDLFRDYYEPPVFI
jgi:predicted nucleotidyltransferase